MQRSGKLFSSALISVSLISSSTAAVAATPQPQAHTQWTTLSMLSGAAVTGTTGVAAAQPDVPPPPPPPRYQGGITTPPLPVILIWLAVIAVDIWILTKGHHHHHFPNSPT